MYNVLKILRNIEYPDIFYMIYALYGIYALYDVYALHDLYALCDLVFRFVFENEPFVLNFQKTKNNRVLKTKQITWMFSDIGYSDKKMYFLFKNDLF